MSEQAFNIFGVRHLSPSAAYHLTCFLEKHKPKCILIEGPSDALDLFYSMADKRVKPPVALMAYTTELPVETILYPFSDYSPEYIAIKWAVNNKAKLRFIDLPANITLRLKQEKNITHVLEEEEENIKLEKEEDNVTLEAEEENIIENYYKFHSKIYDHVANSFDEEDYESYWERNFEHNLLTDTFRTGLELQSEEIRKLVVDHEKEAVPWDFSYNLIREAYMKREIQQTIEEGNKPENIVIIVGAYHVLGLKSNLQPMTDDEFKKLPNVETKMALMPYSYYRLSSRTGYGAGNRAPYYYDLMWKCMKNNEMDKLPAIYISLVGRELRKSGHNASSASIIEAVRLANSLSALRNGSLPVLKDLHDAVITCLGHGELSFVAEAINKVDIGTAIGSLPEGLSQTPVQDDMNRQLKRLKLTNYKSLVQELITLDLRENRNVKSEEAAFLDLNRSVFFNRLQLLNIHFAIPSAVSQSSATWSENWYLQWTPEVEIEIVETNLKGETIELASAYVLKEKLDECTNICEAAALIRLACNCNLIGSFTNALSVLQSLTVDESSFRDTAEASHELSLLLQYGSIRRFNLEHLEPMLQQLFLRAALLLFNASSCDNKAAESIAEAINYMDLISQEHYELVNSDVWLSELKKIAWNDDRNTILSGQAFSILLERNIASEEDCAKEVSRRLSPGVPASLGAGWFEGLSGRNRYALLSRISLWKELDNYIKSLDEDEFLRAVVFLRRAFGAFEANQKNSIAELLGDLWGTGKDTAEILQEELSEDDIQKLDNLNDFDFDNLI